MRIIAGSKRRLRLKSIEGMQTRPTTDRIKETLFNILQNEIPGCYFLDLFAGSGQIGLEAASRGARYVVFAEHAKKAADCIRSNIQSTKSEKECLLLQMDAVSALRSLEGRYQFNVVFLDPPYKSQLEKPVFEYLKTSSLLAENALIIVETARDTDFSYLGEAGFAVVREKNYKTNAHIFIQREGKDETSNLSGEL